MPTLSLKFKVLALLLLALVTTAGAEQEFAKLVRVDERVENDRLRLILRTDKGLPSVSAFFATAPDRLEIELNDTLPEAVLGASPSSRLVSGWSLTRSGLNRTRLTLKLRQRPPYSEIKVMEVADPPHIVVEIPDTDQWNESFAITDGLRWIREDRYVGGRWTRLNRLQFHPKDPQLEVVVGLAKERTDARETLTSMVSRYDAVAGINGGFFAGGGGALGLVYREGRMLVPHVSRRPPRSGFGLTKDGRALFGRLAATGPTIKDLDGGDWSQAWLALGGGPRLLKEGAARITADLEELGPKGNDITRVAARTVVGMEPDGRLTFATVTGYHDNHREGVQFGPLVGWLKSLGITEAVNFDGGASVNMVVGPHIVSDGPANASSEKPVATALLLRDKRPKIYPNTLSWNVSKSTLPADGESYCDISLVVRTPSGEAVPDGTVVRLFARNGRVEPALLKTKNGKVDARFYSVRKPGQAIVQAFAGPVNSQQMFSLRAGITEQLLITTTDAKPAKDKNFQIATVVVETVDQWGNGVPSQRVSCSLDGGEPVLADTDKNGLIAFDAELPADGGHFTVTHPTGGTANFRIPALK